MRTLLALLLALLCAAPASAQFSPGGFGQPGFTVRSSAGAPAYTGPGDVQTWYVYYSLRAYTSATRGNKLVNACHTTAGVDDGCADLSSSASTGNLVPAVVDGSHTCPGAGCNVKVWYNLAGNNCTAANCDITQATVANRATLDANCINTSLSCATFGAGAVFSKYVSANSLTSTAVPYSFTIVAKRTTVALDGVLTIGSSPVGIYYWTSANDPALYAGANQGEGSATDNAFHSIQANFKVDPNSYLYIDGGSSVTFNSISAPALTGTIVLGTSATTNTQFLQGSFVEGGVAQGDITANNSAICHNQFAYWGTAVSC